MKLKGISLIAILLFVIISGCAQQASEPAVRGKEITIDNFQFQPSELIVSAGDIVTWKQDQGVAHIIVSQGSFESKVLNKGDEFSWTFKDKGAYEYYCSIHPSMRGKITVE